MPRASTWLFLATALVATTITASTQSLPADAPSILISRQLAESRGLAVGDVVRLSAEASGRTARLFRIGGVYEPTPDPMRFAQRRLEARLHLPDMLALTADRSDPAVEESITAINIALENPAEASAFVSDV